MLSSRDTCKACGTDLDGPVEQNRGVCASCHDPSEGVTK